MAAIKMLSIEIDGHFHGSANVPKPWVARILGPCPKFGLQREFVQKLNDWKDARVALSGNVYGTVARFPLRDGGLYEISRLRGTSSRRHVAREFVTIDGGKQIRLRPAEALARAVGSGTPFWIDEPASKEDLSSTWVARVLGLGTPVRQGFVVVDGRRLYLLSDGLHEVAEGDRRHFFGLSDGLTTEPLSETEALQWLGAR